MFMHIHRRADAARGLGHRSDASEDDSLFAGWQPEAIEAYRRYLAGGAEDRAGGAGRGAAAERPEDDAVALVRSMYEAFGRRDAATALSLMAPDIELTQSALLPWGGRHVGHAGAQDFLGTLQRHVDSQVEMRAFVPAGDQVAAVGRTRGVTRAARRAFDLDAVHVWTVADGRATRFQAYIDTPAMLDVLR